MSTIIDTLITDRTAADVARVEELATKGFAAMTADERAEWLGGMKGAYNASDLNRVGAALNYLAARLAPNCGTDTGWTAKTDWAVRADVSARHARSAGDRPADLRGRK